MYQECTPLNSKNWAVLLSGADTYIEGYWSQANICHAYNLLVSRGIDPDKIITLSYNDAVNDVSNPYPG